MTTISIVVPVYKCADSLVELHQRTEQAFATSNVAREYILVDDGSPDEAWAVIGQLAQQDTQVKGVRLTRNFGQHYAITAGLQYAQGDWIVVMDGDLQDQPEEIPKLYAATQTGEYDVVLARRSVRLDHWLKRLSSYWFYKTLSYLTDTRQDSSIGNFGIYRRPVITTINAMKENLRYFPVMVRWTGFPATTLDVVHTARAQGESSYTFRKLIHLAFDVMLAFSDKPLRVTVKLGGFISCIAFIFALYVVISSFWGTRPVPGWSSVIVSIWFLAGLMIMILGMIGLYIGKIFDQVKRRPLYIVRTTLNYTDQTLL